MSKFCPECAHPITDSNASFCPKCGAKLPLTPSGMQPPVTQQPAVQQPAYPSYIPPVSKEPSKPTVKRSALEWIAIGCGGIILLVIVSAFIAGMISGISGASSTSSSASKDVIITQDLSSMALTINDFPTGWSTSDPEITETTYNRNFLKQVGLEVYFVYFHMWKYNSTDEAKAEFNSKKAKITTVKVEPVYLGNEGFGYVDRQSAVVVFRKGNIIAQIQYGIGAYMGMSFSTLSLSDAKDYAKIVESRIK